MLLSWVLLPTFFLISHAQYPASYFLQTNKLKSEEGSGENFAVLGSHCFGYHPDTSAYRDDPVGSVDLILKHDPDAVRRSDLHILLFDEEATPWSTLKDKTCEERVRQAYNKNTEFSTTYTVYWNEQGVWKFNRPIKINQTHLKQWTVALVNYNETSDTCKPISNTQYDLRFSDTGLYDHGTGPSNCIPTANQHSNMLGGVMGALAGVMLILAFLLFRQIRAWRQSGGGKMTFRGGDDGGRHDRVSQSDTYFTQ
mmetsp:Transcript_13174/g.25575  ORF Transcript_13174/g.25575 Transcript_13174/m.25575 type:complete len:254 (+) Transcript_13174:36-797(+)